MTANRAAAVFGLCVDRWGAGAVNLYTVPIALLVYAAFGTSPQLIVEVQDVILEQVDTTHCGHVPAGTSAGSGDVA